MSTRTLRSDLAEDGVLLEGRLADYRALFESCNVDDAGSIGLACVQRLGQLLDKPLPEDTVQAAFAARFPDGNGRMTFAGFLQMFQDHLLDLQQIVRYMALESRDEASVGPSAQQEQEDAAALLPTLTLDAPHFLSSSEQFDAAMTLFPDRLVVLLAGLSWCRPCMALSRPFEKLCAHYKDAVFLKVYGDTNDNTKLFFKHRLQVKATPHLSFHRNGKSLFFRTGANKHLLEQAIREHYNDDELGTTFPLPEGVLYPEVKKPEVPPPAAPVSV